MAMYHQIAPQLARDIQTAFPVHPKSSLSDKCPLTLDQVWAIVKIARMVRRSCRSNAAMNPAMELVFPGYKFRQYDLGKRNTRTGKPIMGLSITASNGKKSEDSSEEGDDE